MTLQTIKEKVQNKIIANKEWLFVLFCLTFVVCLFISQGYFNHFFDDSYTWARNGYTGEDRMSVKQFLVSGFLLIIIIYFSVYLRSKNKKQVFKVYQIIWFILVPLEIIKITYSSYFDIINGEAFNWGGILPFYTCSMILFFLPVMIWSKNKELQKYCISFFSTIGIAAGMSNFIYLSTAGFAPIFSFTCFHSYFYHGSLVFVGISLIITKIFVLRWNVIYEAMIPTLIFSIPTTIINYVIYYTTNQNWVDYMLLMAGNRFGFFGQWSRFLHNLHLGFIFTLFVDFVVYPVCIAGLMLIIWGFISFFNFAEKIVLKIKQNKAKKNFTKNSPIEKNSVSVV